MQARFRRSYSPARRSGGLRACLRRRHRFAPPPRMEALNGEGGHRNNLSASKAPFRPHLRPMHLKRLNCATSPGPTTQFPETLFIEPLREKPALARPIRHVFFGIWSLAGETGRNLGLVSGWKNSGPGAACLKLDIIGGIVQVSRIGGSIQRGNRARSPLQCHEVTDHRLRPVRASVR